MSHHHVPSIDRVPRIDNLIVDLGGHFGTTRLMQIRELGLVSNKGGSSLAYVLTNVALSDEIVTEVASQRGLNLDYALKSIGDCPTCGETVLVHPCSISDWDSINGNGRGYSATKCERKRKS